MVVRFSEPTAVVVIVVVQFFGWGSSQPQSTGLNTASIKHTWMYELSTSIGRRVLGVMVDVVEVNGIHPSRRRRITRGGRLDGRNICVGAKVSIG